MNLDPFEECVAGLDYPMVVVTVATETDRDGCLVGFSTQCSIDPARYAVFMSKRNRTTRLATDARTMIVHLLRPSDGALARLFGETSGDDVDKFASCDWHSGPHGVPVLARCDWFAGTILRRLDVGDHVLHLLEIEAGGDAGRSDAGQLGFQAVKNLNAGHDA